MPSRAALLAAALCVAAAAQLRPAAARKVWATVPYTVRGAVAQLASTGAKGGLDVGGQLLLDLELSEGGRPTGRVYGACRAVAAAPGGGVRTLCTNHFEWNGGDSTMVGHASGVFKAGSPLAFKISIVGGIGKWQGAHGEDLEFKFDPKSGAGGGKIVLYCLDGRC